MNAPNEEWRPTVGLQGYAVSNMGRVMRTKPGMGTRANYILKNGRDCYGYPMVRPHVNGKAYGIKVHKLVAEAFLGPRPTPKHEVAHWDGNPENACVTNLRWATRAENHADKIRHGTTNRGEAQGCSKLKSSDIPIILAMRDKGITHIKIAKYFDVTVSNISAILRGVSWSWLTGISRG